MDAKLVIIGVFLGSIHQTGSVEVVKCMTRERPSHIILSCNNGEQIHVYQSYFGLAQLGSNIDCGNPQHTSGDCIMQLNNRTEQLRQACNGFRNCQQWVYYPEDLQCGSESFDERTVYIHVQYECVSNQEPTGQPMTTLLPLSNDYQAHTGIKVYLRSTDYPSSTQSMAASPCHVQLHPDAHIRVDILDLSYNGTASGGSSPYCLYMGDQDQQCAEQGQQFPLYTVEPEEQDQVWFWFWPSDGVTVHPRFWVVLSVLHRDTNQYGGEDWMTVSCGNTGLLTDDPMQHAPAPFRPPGSGTSPLSNDNMPGIAVIIGVASAGTLLILIVIIVLAVLCTKKRKRQREENYDYICHANIAKATKLGAHQRASNPNLSILPVEDNVYSYSDQIAQGELETYGELESQPVSPITPYATTMERAPWEEDADPGHVYGNDDVMCSNMESYGNEAPDAMYENHGYIQNGVSPPWNPPQQNHGYLQNGVSPPWNPPHKNHGYVQNNNGISPPWKPTMRNKDTTSDGTSTLTLQRKSQIMLDLEKLYSKPVKVKSDETSIIENDLYGH